MKKSILLFLFGLAALSLQASVKLAGEIGKYKISMELVKSTANKEFGIRGRYNYAGKTASLELKGNLYGGEALHLIESFEGKKTGEFYLAFTENATWQGKWVGNAKFFEAVLHVEEGEIRELDTKPLKDYQLEANREITGTYVLQDFWVNDYFLTAENLSVEIGFNGGAVSINQLGKNEIDFQFRLTCGPTYHTAYGGGSAIMTAPNLYRYTEKFEYEDEPCELTFTFKDKNLTIKQLSSGSACGFGARASADGEFMKVNNVAVEAIDGEISIQDALGK